MRALPATATTSSGELGGPPNSDLRTTPACCAGLQFDRVIALDSAYHFRTRAAFLRELRRTERVLAEFAPELFARIKRGTLHQASIILAPEALVLPRRA